MQASARSRNMDQPQARLRVERLHVLSGESGVAEMNATGSGL
jgi:hypothetical protein